MGKANKTEREERKKICIDYAVKHFGTGSIGEIRSNLKTKFCRDLFDLMGRQIPNNWEYKNSKTKIPFLFVKRKNWIGIYAEQSWDKFFRWQEIEYKSLDNKNKIRLIRNILKEEYKYKNEDKLEDEILDTSTVKSQLVNLYCPRHGWKEINLSTFFWGTNLFLCQECAHESRCDKYKKNFEDIKKEWNKLERIVEDDQIYENNNTLIKFFSKKYKWRAHQSWQSYQNSKRKGIKDPQDTRALIDILGYLKRLIKEYNEINKTSYEVDQDWDPNDQIGPSFDIRIIAPEFNNYPVYMNWIDFFVQKQVPIFKSMREYQTPYIREYARNTGRIIDKDWLYKGDAHEMIEFTSDKSIYKGMRFKNSWNQINNNLGYSIQAMSNKHDFYSKMIEDLNFVLLNRIIDEEPFNQIINVKCEEGHDINRSLQDFKRAPEGFCLICNDHKPDNFKVFLANERRRNQRCFLYFCELEDEHGNCVKKIGITRYQDRKLRFRSSYLYKELFNHDDICQLTRAEARAVEKRILLDTYEWSYEGGFLSEEGFEGKTELRLIGMPNEFVIRLLKKYLTEVVKKGWLQFWLDRNPGKSEKNYYKKMLNEFSNNE